MKAISKMTIIIMHRNKNRMHILTLLMKSNKIKYLSLIDRGKRSKGTIRKKKKYKIKMKL